MGYKTLEGSKGLPSHLIYSPVFIEIMGHFSTLNFLIILHFLSKYVSNKQWL